MFTMKITKPLKGAYFMVLISSNITKLSKKVNENRSKIVKISPKNNQTLYEFFSISF